MPIICDFEHTYAQISCAHAQNSAHTCTWNLNDIYLTDTQAKTLKITFLAGWPWSLTYDLHLQTRSRYCQGQSLCQISLPYAKRFGRESANWQTHRHTDGSVFITSTADAGGKKCKVSFRLTFCTIQVVWQLHDHYNHGSLGAQGNQKLLHNLSSRMDCPYGDVELGTPNIFREIHGRVDGAHILE